MSYTAPRWILNRLFEGIMALALFNLGVHLMVWPKAVETSAFHYMLDITGPHVLAFVYLTFGVMRIVCLFANGRFRIWGPRLRAVGAIVGGCLWLTMCVALIRYSAGPTPSPGIPLYFTLFIGELFATFMAASDDRSSIR